jgi:[ribosomal protein S18]-alanine N-acetyltransferase
MSAVLRDAGEARLLRPIGAGDLDAMLPIENECYAFPWSRGNFVDSLAAGYWLRGLYAGNGQLLGYMVAMSGADEMHLLNITVARAQQGRGHARCMLDALVAHCAERHARTLWLEVRAGNARAQAIYRRYGFVEVGVRKGYYPAPQSRREDALVMSLDIAARRGLVHALD